MHYNGSFAASLKPEFILTMPCTMFDIDTRVRYRFTYSDKIFLLIVGKI